MPDDVPDSSQPAACEAAAHSRADGEDLIVAALAYLRGISSASGETSGPPSLTRQKEGLRKWAGSMGLLLDASILVPKLERGGMEHDWFREGERVFKVTRDGIFGLSPGIDLAIVTSQPRFDIVPVTLEEIDAWFAAQGFEKVTACGYYRAEDNLGIFDAHAKNLVRFEHDLIPFDVIPCRPAGGFLKFIADTLAAGHTVIAVRTVSTSPRSAE